VGADILKRVLILSDLHVGSLVGLTLPEEYDNYNCITYHATDVGKFLFDKWCEMRNIVGHVDLCVINGDSVDGSNSKSSGTGLYTPDIHAQATTCAKLLQMIDCETFLFTDGSPYHTGRFKGGISGDQLVCDMLNGSWLGLWDTIEVEGIALHVQHYDSVSSVPYSRCTTQQKNSLLMKAQNTTSDIYVRSHTHKFVFSGNSSDLTIGTPCWKGIDEYIGKQKQELPDNGYVLLEIENHDYSWKYNIFSIPFKLYQKGTLKF
jgi:hypothetical protein